MKSIDIRRAEARLERARSLHNEDASFIDVAREPLDKITDGYDRNISPFFDWLHWSNSGSAINAVEMFEHEPTLDNFANCVTRIKSLAKQTLSFHGVKDDVLIGLGLIIVMEKIRDDWRKWLKEHAEIEKLEAELKRTELKVVK